MEIFELMKANQQEQIAFYSDKSVKLRAILSIHSTSLGPAIGGTRFMKYKNEGDAVFDLIRLSKAMTYKAAAGGLNFGGGQIVIIDNATTPCEALFRSLGRFIESFKGRFIAAEDIGITESNMEMMRMETRYVTGLPYYYGGSGDHSLACAYSTLMGLLAAAEYTWQTNKLENRKIMIQGYGRVGQKLAQFLKEQGADVFISDIEPEKVEKARENGFDIVDPLKIYQEKCDIFAPCAVGGIINPQTIKKFKCRIIAGSANNQLLNTGDDQLLSQKGIVYAPDFIINVGGLIDVAEEYLGYKKEKVKHKTENVFNTTLTVLKDAEKKNISSEQSALLYAKNRIESIKNIRGMFLGKGQI